MTDSKNGIVEEILQTDIVSVTSNTEITETSAFQETLNEIPEKVDKANELLKAYRKDPSAFVKDVDEAELDKDLKEINEVVRFSNSIKKSRTEIRRYFNNIRDLAVDELNTRLDEARFDELTDAHTDIKQLKKDIVNQRISDRWKELQPIFEGSIQHYPKIHELAPELVDFSKFRLIHPKMVSGAKTRPITEKIEREVTHIVDEWNTALELIDNNSWGLDATRQFDLLKAFKAEPSVSLIHEQAPRFKTQQDAEIERKRQEKLRRKEQEEKAKKAQEERRKREAELQKQQSLAKKAKDEKEKAEAERRTKELEARAKEAQRKEQERKAELEKLIQKEVSPQVRQSFPNVVEFIFANEAYRNLHTDTQAKAATVFALSQQLNQPNSPILKDTNGDAGLYLDVIRFVLDA